MKEAFSTVVGLAAGLRDLVLPTPCAGCHRADAGLVCPECRARLAAAEPRQVAPDPVPVGLPPCYAIGPYRGELRHLIVAYKERGRHVLAEPLADRLVTAVGAAVPGSRPVVLVPVPTTARAIRQRRGDHMLRLARAVVVRLRREGRPASVMRPLRARPRPDSAGLSATERRQVAAASLTPRRTGPPSGGGSVGRAVVILDDVITTGATVAAACDVLAGLGIPVDAGVVLAATQRRKPRVNHTR